MHLGNGIVDLTVTYLNFNVVDVVIIVFVVVVFRDFVFHLKDMSFITPCLYQPTQVKPPFLLMNSTKIPKQSNH